MVVPGPKPIYSLLSIADLVTILNLLLGFAALIALVNGDTLAGSLLILAAVLGDGADGLLARGAEQSPFGEALDSLADVVAFGVAPALLLTLVLAPWPPAGPALGGGFLACGTLRLARFHLRGPSRESFQGLPITAAGLAAALFLLASPVGLPPWGLAPWGALLSCLMVSNLRYPKLRGRAILLPVGSLAAALLASQLAFPPARPWTALALLGMVSVYLAAPLLRRKPLEAGPREAP
ncbi:MAG: CDP-alcohol phosphatidyltransferase family protein [Halobacteria archaeon]